MLTEPLTVVRVRTLPSGNVAVTVGDGHGRHVSVTVAGPHPTQQLIREAVAAVVAHQRVAPPAGGPRVGGPPEVPRGL